MQNRQNPLLPSFQADLEQQVRAAELNVYTDHIQLIAKIYLTQFFDKGACPSIMINTYKATQKKASPKPQEIKDAMTHQAALPPTAIHKPVASHDEKKKRKQRQIR